MTIELSTRDRRDLDALLYLVNADRWQKRIVLRDGKRAYGLPSRSRAGLYHLTDGASCTCEDWKNHQPEGGCSHMRAAVLYRMERQAEQAKAARYAALFPEDDDKPWCPACNRHHTTNMHYGRRAS